MPEASSYHEKELFLRIAEGDEAAFRRIFHEYNARLFHTVLKLVRSDTEAEEIVQEVFLRLWLRRTDLLQVQNPPAWLFTIASNLSLDVLRKQARTKLNAVTAAAPDIPDDLSPSHLLESKEVRRLIEEAVQELPAARREIFRLSRVHQLNRKQIADQLQISESTVKNQLTSALKFIQHYIREKSDLYLPVFLLHYLS